MYYRALELIGDEFEGFDSDNLIPMFGFGAKVPEGKSVSHCFAMNGDIAHPYVFGKKGILDSYVSCTPLVEMAGPTYLHVILKTVNDLCEEQVKVLKPNDVSTHKYSILLILTDGSVDYLREKETEEQIVRSSHLPLSIIILGIGRDKDDFCFMRKLDAD